MWIVKLGGSLWDAPELPAWLRALAREPGPARLVVPGGGPFADAVRRAQPVMGFSDLAAHRMAILAMEQTAWAWHDLEPGLRPVRTRREIARLAAAEQGGIWLPWRLAGLCAELAPSWAVTSDSIALWLARRSSATGLVLVKSAALPEGRCEARALVAAGLIDAAFPETVRDFGGEVRLVPRTVPWSADWVRTGRFPGTLIVP